MTMTETFHLGTLISTASDIFVGPRDFGDVHKLVEHLAGGPVWTHQLPAAMEALKPCLLGQHPWLVDIVPPEFPQEDIREAVAAWLAEQVEHYGEHHEVTVCEGGWFRNPVTDLVEMMGPEKVIPVIDR